MCIAALTGLVMMVMISRFFGNLSNYAEYNTDLATIVMHTLYSIPQVMYWVLPFSVCLGILATQAALSRHMETIAMQACSVSTWRIFFPYILVGILATCVMSLLSFHIYPVSQRNADRIENIYIKKRDIEGSFSVTGGRFKVDGNIYFVEHLDIEHGIMQNVTCYHTDSGRLSRIIHCQEARWNDHRWIADRVQVIKMDDRGITTESSDPVLPLTRGPADLVMAQTSPDVLPISELRQYLNQLHLNNIRSPSVETVYYSRISFTISPFIMTILVLPFGMRFPRAGGIASGISIGLILGLLYWFLHSGMTSLGSSGTLQPVLAAWLANAVALAVGLILMFTRRSTYG